MTTPEPSRLRLITDVAVPVLPACQLMLAGLNGDTAQVDALRRQADPGTLTLSLLKLAAMLGWAAYDSDLYEQINMLAVDRDFAGEEVIHG